MTETKKREIQIINSIQDKYVKQLIKTLDDSASVKEVFLTSPTGTGKSKMIAKLINSEWGKKHFFVITTLSRGDLNIQLNDSLQKDCNPDDFIVYGSSQLTATTLLRPADVQATVREKANNRPIIWIRDEAHIETNNFKIALENMYEHIVNVSATNSIQGIECDFSATCMLRTPVVEKTGDVSVALDKLLEVKKQHAIVPHYNPCAVFRCINNPILHDQITTECEKRGLKYIDLNEDDTVSMKELCQDDNEYDVIINKRKIVEGVDLKRAHVMYLGNIPSNPATIIQFAGRARRNALLWKTDFDIFDERYADLYNSTKNCYIFFNVDCKDSKEQQKVEETLRNAFRDTRSVEEFTVGTKLEVNNGQLLNGISVYQLLGQTGTFVVVHDDRLNCNVVNPLSDFYSTKERAVGVIPAHGYKIVEQELWGERTVGYYDTDKNRKIPYSIYVPYKQKVNDYESAAIACEYFKYISDCKKWTTIKSISDFLDKTSSTAVAFIDNKYKEELNYGIQCIEERHLSAGKNSFDFNKICNSCLGWLVEFYTKYLIFGRDFLFEEIKEAQSEAKTDAESQPIIFYACYLKYKKIMTAAFGNSVAKFIKGPSISDYIKADYKKFVDTVITLAKRTQDFLVNQLHLSFKKDGLLFDEKLSIQNITGKADFVAEDTIVDLKTTNNITKRYIRQVLFYHYLSTKRSDLNIKRVIVYDCVSGNYVEVPINAKNYTDYYNPIPKLDDNALPTISPSDLKEKVFLQPFDMKQLLLKWFKEGRLEPYKGDVSKIFFINEAIDVKTGKQQEAETLLLNRAAKESGWLPWQEILDDFRRKDGFSGIYKSQNSVKNLIEKHIAVKKGKQFLVINLPNYWGYDYRWTLKHLWITYLHKHIPLIQFKDKVYYVYNDSINELTTCQDFDEYDNSTAYYYYDHYENLLSEQLMEPFKQLQCNFLAEETSKWCAWIQEKLNKDSLFGCHEQIAPYVYTPIYKAIKKELCNNNGNVVINSQYIGNVLKSSLGRIKKHRRIRKQLKKLMLVLMSAETLTPVELPNSTIPVEDRKKSLDRA